MQVERSNHCTTKCNAARDDDHKTCWCGVFTKGETAKEENSLNKRGGTFGSSKQKT